MSAGNLQLPSLHEAFSRYNGVAMLSRSREWQQDQSLVCLPFGAYSSVSHAQGVLYEDGTVQVGLKTRYQGTKGQLGVFIGNKRQASRHASIFALLICT